MSGLKRCPCGGSPKFYAVQVAEDAVESWVECPRCNAATDRIEDAYSDRPTAEWQWNRGDALKPQDARP